MFVDGLEIRLAKLSVKRGNVVLEELKAATLVARLDEQGAVEVPVEQAPAAGTTDDFTAASEASTDNNSVLLSLLSGYPQGKFVLGYAISEPSLYYHTFESDFGLAGKKLKVKVIDELRHVRATQPFPDAVDLFPSAEKNLVCVVREDGLSFLRAIEQITPFIGRRLPRFPLIESAEIALINLARANFGFAPEDITVIIYVGVEFSRLIFMKGTDFLHFAPLIGEGHDAPNIQNTVYSRLLLEQDNIGIPRINRILLAGESRKIAFDDFLREQLPEVEIQYLNTPYLDVSELPAEVQEQIPEYAVPIATAWKLLDEEHPAFYPINLLPESVRESQRAFKLAWHGYLLLALVFVLTIYFPQRFFGLKTELEKRQSTVAQLQVKVDENKQLQRAIDSLNNEISRYNTALGVYKSLVAGTVQWNKTLERLSKGVEDLNSIWIEELKAPPGNQIGLQGIALSRPPVPRMAALFDNSTLEKVVEDAVRQKPVYRFTIKAPVQNESLDSLTIRMGARK
jgi:Tfp pilus assembly protein PilN